MPPTPEEPESSPGGDARLRAAVAAWVATADEPDEPDESDGPDESAVGAGAAGAADADADAKSESAEAGGSGVGAGAEGGSASGRGGAGAGSGADGDEPQAADEPEPEPVAASESDADEAGSADRTSDSASDDEQPGDESPEGDAAEAASATEGGSAGSRAAADEPADGDEPQAADTADEPDDEPADADPTPDTDSDGEWDERAVSGGDEPARTEPADADSDATAESGSASSSGTAKAGADGGAGDDPAAAAVAGGGESARAESHSGSAADDSAPKAGTDSGAAGAGKSAPEVGAGSGSDSGTGSGAGSEPPEPRQDQHTAVFKAVRPGRPVDRPTTTLKAVRPSAPMEPPESAAERTSTFVPLKPDDVRQAPPRKPEQKPEGTPAAPPAPPARPAAAPGRPAPPPAAPAASQAIPEAERTRQQPMPPRPPLDLLAELTNKPAPPETPARIAVRRVKIWTPLVLLVVVLFAVVQFLRPLPAPALTLTADASYTFKGGALDMPWPSTGQSAVEVQGVGSLGTDGAQESAPIASVAKVMTAYVILKDHPLKGKEVGPKIEVDALAEEQSKSPDESTAPIKEGQQFTEKQMLQLLMIPSGNNAARLLARWDADSEDAFVKKMNDAAKDLGMKNSTYTDPSGFEKTTVSTATDQLKLAKAVMEYDVFRGIVDLPEVEIPGIDGKIYNNNNLLLEPGVSGIKTGSTSPAGGNLVWAADTIIDGKKRRIVGAVMGQQTDGTLHEKLQLSLTNSLKLIQAAQRDVTSATVVKKGEVVGYIDDGLGGQTAVVATKDLKAVGWPGLKVELAISDGGKTPPHAAKAGTEVGQLTVGTGPGQVKAPVALQKDLVEPAFGDKLARIG